MPCERNNPPCSFWPRRQYRETTEQEGDVDHDKAMLADSYHIEIAKHSAMTQHSARCCKILLDYGE